MKRIPNYNDIPVSGDYKRLAPGGYVIKITDIQDDAEKQYLRITYDIAEGPEAGRYKDELPENAYRHQFIRSYKEKALGMFKAFTNAVEASNNGYKWDFDEKTLKGKILGVVFGYEEYEANDGNVKERLRIASCIDADRVLKGDFKIPDLKKLSKATNPAPNSIPNGFSPLGDEDLPF